MNARKLLVVDDQADMCDIVCEIAEDCGYSVQSASDADSFGQLYSDDFDVIILDLVMPGTDGIELLRYLADHNCKAAVILMSGFDKRVLDTARQLGSAHGLNVLGSLLKPFRIKELQDMLNSLESTSTKTMTHEKTGPELSCEDLAEAIQKDQLILYFQPQLELKSGKVYGAEALCRWVHPKHGMIFPDQFISLAEDCGLMPQLTDRVLKLALENCSTWRKQGLELSVSVNIPVSILSDLSLPNNISDLMKSAGVPPNSILLEVTETGLIQELRECLDVLTRLRMKGLELAVDDFGTGYSSFSQVQNIPATELKIDKSFVMNMLESESARAIVDSVIDIGKRLNMRVLAEGIETDEIHSELAASGCRYGQGYLFSRPVAPDQFLDWIRQTPWKSGT